MDKFERQLKALPLARPSAELRERIFGPPAARRWSLGALLERPVPMGWAAGFSLATGLAGLLIALLWNGITERPASQASSPAAQVQIINIREDGGLLNFTEPAAEFLPGGLSVKVQTGGEV